MNADDDVLALIFEFDDLPNLVGREFRGPWMTVDEHHLELFDEAVYANENPHPFDPSFYPERLVEGFHLIGLLDHLQNPLIRLSSGRLTGWNYGFDRLRFTSPVSAGEPLRLTGAIASVTARGDGFLVGSDCAIEVRSRDKPAMVASWLTLFYRGDGPETE